MKVEITKLNCKRCGHSWYPKQPEVRICPKCKSAYWDKDTKGTKMKWDGKRKGAGNPHWKGGQKRNQEGYVLILKPEHHRAQADGYVKRCILSLEERLERPMLDGHVPHHINEIIDDDRPENVMEVTPAHHNTIHKKGKCRPCLNRRKCDYDIVDWFAQNITSNQLELSKMIGLSQPTISRILRRTRNV